MNKNSISAIIVIALLVISNQKSFSQNVGIGTTSPLARLHVIDSNVVFSAAGLAPSIAGNPPLQGPGRRMMWYPGKAAFRVGYVGGPEWDKDSIGRGSFASNYHTQASGDYSTAMGYSTTASGIHSFASGVNTKSSHTASTAMGFGTDASGAHSIAAGYDTRASGGNSTAMGFRTSASGDISTAMGEYAYAVGKISTAFGSHTWSYGFAGTAIGMWNDPLVGIQTAVTGTTPLFIVGNGDDHPSRSNAMVVLKNGNVGIGTPGNPSERLHVDGGDVRVNNTANTTIQLQAAGVDKGFVQLSSNNLRIGTYSSNPTANFIVRTNGNDQLLIFPSGNALLAGTLTQNSDARYKQNIEPLSNSLHKLLQLSGYQYYWKTDLKRDAGLQIGLIAQNVESVFPELVTNDDKGMKSVAYQNLVPVLIEAVKEQQGIIQKQQTTIDDLAKRIEKLELKQRD